MAVSLNKVLLMGNLTGDPALRYTPGGAAVCELRMAINRNFMGSNGQAREEVCYVDVTVWGKSAENCPRFLSKGSPVFIEGRLQLDQWEDRETGKKASKLRVVAESVQFLSGGRRDDQGGAGGYQQQPSYAQNQPPRQEGGAPRNFQPRQNAPGQGGNGPLQRRQDASQAPQQQPAMPPLPDDPYTAGADDDIPF